MTDTDEIITKSPNRAKKAPVARKPKFDPIPEIDPKTHESNKVPTPAAQEAIVALFDTYSAKDQATIMSFVGSREFMGPGYGKSTRFIKMWVARQPKPVKLSR